MQLRDLYIASTFDQASDLFETGHKWRDHPMCSDLVRALGRNRKKFVNIRKLSLENCSGFGLRYHNTDVVRWTRSRDHDTGANVDTVTVEAWSSLSTNTFAEAFTPANLRFDFAHGDGAFVHVLMGKLGDYEDYNQRLLATRVYEFKTTHMAFQFDNDHGHFMPDIQDCAEMRFLDTRSPAMRTALLNTEYPNFSKWLNAVCTIDGMDHVSRKRIDAHALTDKADEAVKAAGGIAGLLADPDKWLHLRFSSYTSDIRDHNNWLRIGDRECIKLAVRKAIYADANLPASHSVTWMDGKQFEKQRRIRNTYAWAT